MILRELYYFDKNTMDAVEDDRYNPSDDDSIVKKDDTRKTRLTLKDINRARRADDMHRQESQQDLGYIRKMYGLASQAEAGGELV
jgi:hypothetical protein